MSIATAVRRPVITIAAVTTLALGLVACHGKSSTDGGGGNTPPPSSAGSSANSGTGPAKSAVTVDVKNFQFTPMDAVVTKGGKVTWKFEDSADHNVDFSSGGIKKSPDLNDGKTYTATFNTPGTYSYICSIHQYMKGEVTVK